MIFMCFSLTVNLCSIITILPKRWREGLQEENFSYFMIPKNTKSQIQSLSAIIQMKFWVKKNWREPKMSFK